MPTVKPVKSFQVDKLKVQVYDTAADMGQAAADLTSEHLQAAITTKGHANFISGTGASQFTYYDALVKAGAIDWSRVTAFHLDEYRGMAADHPASFRKFMQERLWDIVQPGEVQLLGGDADDIDGEVLRYEKELKAHPADLACIGVGENGHIAFNDPHVADFDDPRLVKVVELDETCRRQQLGEGWFPTLEDVPPQALSLTIPALMNADVVIAIVPDTRKAQAIANALYGPIGTACPASILRTHPNATLLLDRNAASRTDQGIVRPVVNS